jgi:hypothetical protein
LSSNRDFTFLSQNSIAILGITIFTALLKNVSAHGAFTPLKNTVVVLACKRNQCKFAQQATSIMTHQLDSFAAMPHVKSSWSLGGQVDYPD